MSQLSTGQVEVEPRVIYHVTEYRERRNHFAYFSCSVPTAGFDTSRDAFVGVHEGMDAPACSAPPASAWPASTEG